MAVLREISSFCSQCPSVEDGECYDLNPVEANAESDEAEPCVIMIFLRNNLVIRNDL